MKTKLQIKYLSLSTITLLISISLLCACNIAPAVSNSTSLSGNSTITSNSVSSNISSAPHSSVSSNISSTSQNSIADDDFTTISETIIFNDLGIKVFRSYLNWSPDSEFLVFMGEEIENADGKYAVYLYKLSDKSITKVLSTEYTSNPILAEPSWSDDGTLFTIGYYQSDKDRFVLYTYDITGSKSQLITEDARSASISHDKSKVAYVLNEEIFVYSNSSNTIEPITSGILCDSPIWTKDDSELIFNRYSGHMSELNGVPQCDLCSVDLASKSILPLIINAGYNQRLEWVKDEELIYGDLIGEGMHYTYAFNIKDSTLLKLEGNNYSQAIPYQVIDDKAYFFSFSNIVTVFNERFEKTSEFTIEHALKQTSNNSVLSRGIALLNENELLYLTRDFSTGKGMLLMSYFNEKKSVQIYSMSDLYEPIFNPKGNKVIFFSFDRSIIEIVDLGLVN